MIRNWDPDIYLWVSYTFQWWEKALQHKQKIIYSIITHCTGDSEEWDFVRTPPFSNRKISILFVNKRKYIHIIFSTFLSPPKISTETPPIQNSIQNIPSFSCLFFFLLLQCERNWRVDHNHGHIPDGSHIWFMQKILTEIFL